MAGLQCCCSVLSRLVNQQGAGPTPCSPAQHSTFLTKKFICGATVPGSALALQVPVTVLTISGTRACGVMRRCRRPSVTFDYQMPRRLYVPTDAALQDRVIVHAHAYPMRSDWTTSLDQYEALQTPLASRLGSWRRVTFCVDFRPSVQSDVTHWSGQLTSDTPASSTRTLRAYAHCSKLSLISFFELEDAK